MEHGGRAGSWRHFRDEVLDRGTWAIREWDRPVPRCGLGKRGAGQRANQLDRAAGDVVGGDDLCELAAVGLCPADRQRADADAHQHIDEHTNEHADADTHQHIDEHTDEHADADTHQHIDEHTDEHTHGYYDDWRDGDIDRHTDVDQHTH